MLERPEGARCFGNSLPPAHREPLIASRRRRRRFRESRIAAFVQVCARGIPAEVRCPADVRDRNPRSHLGGTMVGTTDTIVRLARGIAVVAAAAALTAPAASATAGSRYSSQRLITDTLAPGGAARTREYRFIT